MARYQLVVRYCFGGVHKEYLLDFLMWFWLASSLICGNKMPTSSNRGFYCRSYYLFNMFRAPLCPSSGAQEYYTLVAACGISCFGFQVAGLVWSWGLCVWYAGCCSILQTRHITLLHLVGILFPHNIVLNEKLHVLVFINYWIEKCTVKHWNLLTKTILHLTGACTKNAIVSQALLI